MMIEEYVDSLDRALSGPGRLKDDLLTEARHGLVDAAQGYRATGLAEREAQRRAVAEFGEVGELAPAYQAELAMSAARRLALRMALVPVLFAALANLMWWRAPWATTAAPPPAGYRLLSDVQDYLGYGYALLALAAYAALTWTSRRGGSPSRGAARAIGVGTFVAVGLGWVGGTVMYAWSVRLWDAALTWPPMLIGGLAILATYAWLVQSAATCLAAARR